MKSELKYWLNYFNNNDIVISVDNSLYLYRSFLKSEKEMLKLGKTDQLNVIRYRKNMLENIIMSTDEYINGEYLEIRGFMREHKNKLLKVRPTYTISPTYRIVSENPSLGNLDYVLRKIIVPNEGKYFVSLDYMHQEPWIIVNLLDNKELKEIIINEKDFYVGLLKKFNVDVDINKREIMKKVWNTSIYGSSLNNIKDNSLPWIEEVYDWINSMDEIISLRNKVKKNMKNNKEIYTIFGLNRKLSYDGKTSVRKAFNSIFQMSGSGVLYTGLKSIHNAVTTKETNTDVRIYLTNHDEYILEVNNSISHKEIMSFISSIDFNIDGWTIPRFKIKIGDNWGELS